MCVRVFVQVSVGGCAQAWMRVCARACIQLRARYSFKRFIDERPHAAPCIFLRHRGGDAYVTSSIGPSFCTSLSSSSVITWGRRGSAPFMRFRGESCRRGWRALPDRDDSLLKTVSLRDRDRDRQFSIERGICEFTRLKADKSCRYGYRTR